MTRSPLFVFVLFALLAACDSPTGTRGAVVDVRVSPGDAHLPVGGTQQLTATLRDERGSEVTRAEVEWRSSNPDAVSVSPTGLVTARAAGEARITARVGSVEGAALVSVAVPLPASCRRVPSLAVGQVYTAASGEGSVLCLPGGATGAEYTLIPFYGSAVAGARAALEIGARGTYAVSSALGGAPLTSEAAGTGMAAQLPDAGWELRLREREIRELTPRIPAIQQALARGELQPFSAEVLAVPTVGTRLSLNVNSAASCRDPDFRTGRIVAVTRHAIVVADTANPDGGFTDAEYESFGRAFDDIIHPVVTQNFGEPSDIDQNGRIVIFYTRAVNELTLRERQRTGSSDIVVGGFFFSRDLFPKAGSGELQACAGSNESEIVYLMVPDPSRPNDAAFQKDNVVRSTLSVLGHEYQHLINAAQRLFVVKTGSFEETWLNEALSHIAEELLGNHVAGFAQRTNLDYARVSATEQTRSAFNTYHSANFARLERHLRASSATALFDPQAPLAARGASWQFLRYAADRRGGAEPAFWRSLVRTRATGLQNLQAALGVDPVLWMRDWAVAVYTDDAFAGVGAEWTQPSWNFRSVYTGHPGYKQYPLVTTALPVSGTTSTSITAGGAAYLRFGVGAGGEGEIRTSSGGLTPPHRLLISVVRTR